MNHGIVGCSGCQQHFGPLKTTEFWLSAAATLVGLAIASGIVPTTGTWPQIVGLVTGVLGALGYTVSRTAVKNG